jgi:hypothetical protein
LIVDSGMKQSKHADRHRRHAGRDDENAAGQVACGDREHRQPSGGQPGSARRGARLVLVL